MSTLNQIVFQILDSIKPENLTSDIISTELVKQYVKTTRATLLRQDINKGHTIDSYIVQSLGCINFVEIDKSSCPCDFPTGCKVLRSEVKIPSPIESHNRQMFVRVGPVDLYAKPWQQVELERVPFEGYNKYTINLIKWFTINNDGYIYLLIRSGDLLLNSIEVGNVQLVLEDPEEAQNFTNCSTGNACYSSDSQFPCKEHMVDMIVEIVKKKLLQTLNSPVDGSNDGKINPQTTISNGQ